MFSVSIKEINKLISKVMSNIYSWVTIEKKATRDTTLVQHDTIRHNTRTTRHNTSTTRPNTSTKEAQAAKIGFYIELYFSQFCLELVNIVLHVTLFQPFEYQRFIIRPSEMLNNQGHMTFCAKLSAFRI